MAHRPLRHAALLSAAASLALGCGSTGPSVSRSSVEVVPVRTTHVADFEVKTKRWHPTVVERCQELEPLMRAAAMSHGVDVGLIAGIIHVESKFRPEAESRRGALGLMQVMPSVADRLDCGDLEDPEENMTCGLTVFQRFMAHYDHELIYGLSAYNAGYRIPNAARRERRLPKNFRYVEKVLGARASYLRFGCR